MSNNSLVPQVIVDADIGGDDFIAILLLLQAEKLGLVVIHAILCSMGNASLMDTCTNLMRLLEIVKRTDIPVYKGVEKALIPPQIDYFFGHDGMGDLNYTWQPDMSKIRETPSPIALQEIISKNKQQISLITLGPLTNLAIANKLYDGQVLDNVKELWVMGGNYQGKGNTSPYAEYNFFVDVEAAHIVLNQTTKPITLFTWETCINTTIPLVWALNNLKNKTEALDLFVDAMQSVYGKIPQDKWYSCDSFMMFDFLYKKEDLGQFIERQGHVKLCDVNRGEVILTCGDEEVEPNLKILQEFDEEAYLKKLLALDL